MARKAPATMDAPPAAARTRLLTFKEGALWIVLGVASFHVAYAFPAAKAFSIRVRIVAKKSSAKRIRLMSIEKSRSS